jgi:hypothetical protein
MVTVTFSEPMDQATITSLTFTLLQGSTPVTGTVSYSGSTATFTPTVNLGVSKIYTGTVTTGAENVAGLGLAANHTFSFTTGTLSDNTLPVVNSLNPLSSATAVPLNKIVSATFSKSMNPATINSLTFTLKKGGTLVSGAVAYNGTTATFTSSGTLTASTVYTATLTTGVKDLAGNALATDNVWSFTTGTTTSLLEAVNLGASGNYVILAKTAVTNVLYNRILDCKSNRICNICPGNRENICSRHGGSDRY